jgi:DNA-directed RNA polymerase III subunit RPC6
MSAAKRPRKGPNVKEIAEQIVRVCSAPENRKGCAQDDLESALGNTAKDVILQALNLLIKQNKLVPCPGHDGKMLFRLKTAEEVAKFQGLVAEDMLVYQEVERAGTSGISTKDLSTRANLQPPQLTKVLKTLETRKLVRPVKSMNKNKKMYLLYDLEASREITGGTFYSGQEFDHELIIRLQEAALAIIIREDSASAQKVHEFIEQSGLVHGKQLEMSDITSVLDTLVYDGRIEKARDPFARSGDPVTYRIAHSVSTIESLVRHFTSVPSGCECLACTTRLPGELCPTLSTWLDEAARRDPL